MSASISREVRDRQIVQAEVAVTARVDSLKERGVGEAAHAKDTVLKSLRSQLKKARARVRSMEASVAHVAKVKDDKKPKKTVTKGGSGKSKSAKKVPAANKPQKQGGQKGTKKKK